MLTPHPFFLILPLNNDNPTSAMKQKGNIYIIIIDFPEYRDYTLFANWVMLEYSMNIFTRSAK